MSPSLCRYASPPSPLTPREEPFVLAHLTSALRTKAARVSLMWLTVIAIACAGAEVAQPLVAIAVVLTFVIALGPALEAFGEPLPLPARYHLEMSRRFKVRTGRLWYLGHPEEEQLLSTARGLSHRRVWDELAAVAWDKEQDEAIRLRRALLAAEAEQQEAVPA